MQITSHNVLYGLFIKLTSEHVNELTAIEDGNSFHAIDEETFGFFDSGWDIPFVDISDANMDKFVFYEAYENNWDKYPDIYVLEKECIDAFKYRKKGWNLSVTDHEIEDAIKHHSVPGYCEV